MTNREWLNNMALIDMLDLISKKSASCLLYLLTNEDYDAIVGKCSKGCYECLRMWLNEQHN